MPRSMKGSKPSAAQKEYMRGGKGRKDEVGKSGIYPASSPDAPGDAVIRSEAELVGHSTAPRSRSRTEKAIKGDYSDSVE